MKGMISGIKRMEIHDGDGLRTTVFFKGCPLKCIWCHNPESIDYHKQIAIIKNKCILCGTCRSVCPHGAVYLTDKCSQIDFSKCVKCFDCVNTCPTGAMTLYGKEYTVNELVDILMQDEPFFKNSGGGVTLSGGECLAQPDFVVELAKELYQKDIRVNIDTCGFVKQEIFDRMIPYTDVFLYDMKAFDTFVHKQCTGQGNEIILSNLKYLVKKGCKIEIRYPLVMGYNDKECEKIAKFLSSLGGIKKVKVLQYHKFAGSRYDALGMVNTLPDTETTYDDIEHAVNILKSYGLNAVNGINN